jgi:hypothetical protein
MIPLVTRGFSLFGKDGFKKEIYSSEEWAKDILTSLGITENKPNG